MQDLIGSLSKVSGLSADDVKQIWEEVKLNKVKLDKCKGPHDFQAMSTDAGMTRTKYRCVSCGGVVDAPYRRAYEEGLAHGRAFPRLDNPS